MCPAEPDILSPVFITISPLLEELEPVTIDIGLDDSTASKDGEDW